MSVEVSHRPERTAAAPPLTGGGAGPLRRFEWCVRSSVYVVMATELMIVPSWALRFGGTPAQLGLLVIVTTLHVVADVVLLAWALDSLKIRDPAAGLPRARLLAVGASTVASMVCLYLFLGPAATSIGVYVVAPAWAALAPALDYRRAGLGVVGIGVPIVVALLVMMDGPMITKLVSAAGLVLIVLALTASVWLSGWMLRVYWELHLARLDSARLAIADERLRISRDLHDVFGRTLATVSVKSELAAELARRGRSEEAAAEIGQVSQIADQAGQEVRRVLRGYREADLEVELAGARSLLAAAGVACTVEMVPGRFSPEVTSTLAWVTREAVTNIIRHAQATLASITLTGNESLVLTIDNDGAVPHEGPAVGQGLVGMAERVAAAGGQLEHGYQAGHFTVRVELPAGASA